jgi:hypothetical protein
VLAVEALAGPLVLQKTKIRTLGKVLATLRDQGNKQWSFVLDGANGLTRFIQMGELIWENQKRHAPETEEEPLKVTPAQSEAALHIAITLVQLLRSGALQRKKN